MKIYALNQENLDQSTRKHGKSLFEQGFRDYVFIFRACRHSITHFLPNDYITRSKKFAIEHADHQTAVNEEVYHVIYALVSPKDVKDAYNPGEYFWTGKETKGRVLYTSDLNL